MKKLLNLKYNLKTKAMPIVAGVALLGLSACATVFNNMQHSSLSSVSKLSASAIAKAVDIKNTEYDSDITYTAQGVVLPVKDAMSLKNSEYYQLVAIKDKANGDTSYVLRVNIKYFAADVKRYDTASDKTAKQFEVITVTPKVASCHVSGFCDYVESVGISISKHYLDSHKSKGLDLRLTGATKDDLFIKVPANYIKGFLQAVNS